MPLDLPHDSVIVMRIGPWSPGAIEPPDVDARREGMAPGGYRCFEYRLRAVCNVLAGGSKIGGTPDGIRWESPNLSSVTHQLREGC